MLPVPPLCRFRALPRSGYTRRLQAPLLAGLLLLAINACAVNPIAPIKVDEFGARQDWGKVQHGPLTEVSGLVASRRNEGVLWVHNDSGDMNKLYAMDFHGRHLGVYWAEGCKPRDWEDMAIGPGPKPAADYLYVGNIGDNAGLFEEGYICRVPEPAVGRVQLVAERRLAGAEVLAFQYPDGPRDAEALMVDPITADIYVISKREPQVTVYRAPYPQPFGGTVVLDAVATLPLTMVTAADISPDGEEILIKTPAAVYYWRRDPEQPLWTAFEAPPQRVPYRREPQGEAVGWRADGSGYFTISEEAMGMPAHVFFYPRID